MRSTADPLNRLLACRGEGAVTIAFDSVDARDARDERLRADLLGIWIAVTNAGGSVGFTAPAPVDVIARTLDRALERVSSGADALGILRTGDAAIGMGILVDRDSDVCRHWRTVLRVMVHPDHQGQGAGVTLMHGLHRLGRPRGLEQLQLTEFVTRLLPH